MRHTISVLVENKFGVLARVAGLFSGRGYNIESLCVAPTMDPTVSQMTIVTNGDDRTIEQVTKQLNKLIDVIKVVDVTAKDFVDRELILLRVKTDRSTQDEVLRIVDMFKGKVVDVGNHVLTAEFTGDDGKIETLLRLLKPVGIIEIVRTGKVALLRAEQNRG